MRNRFKTYLDYVPLIILLISGVVLIWTISTSDIVMVWKHYIGLAFLAIVITLFYLRHVYGVLFVGFTFIVGLVGLLSYSPAITTYSLGTGNSETGLTLLKIQPIFLLWLVIYFVTSGRHFVGIASRKYWAEVRNKER